MKTPINNDPTLDEEIRAELAEVQRKADTQLRRRRLPFRPLKRRPADPKEARRWLAKVADHLSTYPYASAALRFVASAIKRYLQGSKNLNVDRARSLLYSELCLVDRSGKRQTFSERTKRRADGAVIESLMQKNKKQSLRMIADEMGKDKRTVEGIYEEWVIKKHIAALDSDIKEFVDVEMLKPAFPHDKSS